MNDYSHYCVLKMYKGLIFKKHAGNVQLFITSLGKDFKGFLILGYLDRENSVWVARLIASGKNQYKDIFINDISEDTNFEEVESLKVNVKETNKGIYSLKYAKKGKYIKSDLRVEYEPEYSNSSNGTIYTIHGKLELLFDEHISQNQISMKSMKDNSVFKSILKNKVMKEK